MSQLSANLNKRRHIAFLRDILLPENEFIAPGDFIEENFNYLEILGKISALDDVSPDNKKPAANIWSAQSGLLDFADSLLEGGDTVLFPYVAIIGAHVARGSQGKDLTPRIQDLFDKLDKRFDVINVTANKAQLVEFRDVEFETYYCAARMISFEGHAIAPRVYKRANYLLNKLIDDGEDDVYLNYLLAGVNSKSPQFPSGETFLWTNFAANMDRLTKLYNNPKTSAKSQVLLLTQVLQISGNIAVELPEESMLVAPVVQHFSSAWNDLLERDEDKAAGVILGAQERIAGDGLRVNSAFLNILSQKTAILGSNMGLSAKPVHNLPARPGKEDDRTRQMRAAWKSLNLAARKVAQLN